MQKKWIVSALMIPLLFGCATSTQPTSKDMVASMERVDNHDGLIQHYKGHLQSDPEDVTVTQALAQVYYDKGDVESAKFYTDHLLNKGIKNWQLLQLRGQIHSDQGENGLAIQRYTQSLDVGNKTSAIHVMLGIAYCKQDRFTDAELEFNKARLQGHNDVTIKNNLAVIYLAQGRYQRVAEMLTPVFRENPSNQVVKANLAIALFKLGDFDQARELVNDDFTNSQMIAISRQLYNFDG